MRAKTGNEAGFTLIEALLVITIGTVLLSSGTVLYNQYRQSVGDSAAYEKVVALQSCVEGLYAINKQTYPDNTTLSNYWQGKRPQDYNLSPWGGLAVKVTVTDNHVLGGSAAGVVPNPTAGDYGVLYYWHTTPENGTLTASDSAGGGATSVGFHNYLVAIVPDRYTGTPPYMFVRGARMGSSADNLEGTVGGSGPSGSQSPW